MYKIIRASSLLLLVLLLCASCASGTKTETGDAPSPAETEATAPAAAKTEPLTPDGAKELALACVDGPVEALYEKIGRPESSDYAPSCMGDGEDGNLYYDAYGFIVYTYREGSQETVRDVG